jgi:hypothetical protein
VRRWQTSRAAFEISLCGVGGFRTRKSVQKRAKRACFAMWTLQNDTLELKIDY